MVDTVMSFLILLNITIIGVKCGTVIEDILKALKNKNK